MDTLSRRRLLVAGSLAVASIATDLAPPLTAAAATAAEDGARLRQSTSPKLKVVVTGGHPGDPEYGCGGTIARYTDLGHAVTLLYLNHGDPREVPGDNRPLPRVAEATRACGILGARPVFADQIDGNAVLDAAHYQAFRTLLAAEKPDVVFTHWPIDNHADHRSMSLLVYDAWLHAGKKFTLFYYEVSTGEDTVQFTPGEYLDISATESRKRQACFAHASQSPDRFYKLQDMTSRMRGLESGHVHAEAFVRHIQSPPSALPGN